MRFETKIDVIGSGVKNTYYMTYLNYRINTGFSNSVSTLVEFFQKIASDNNMFIDDLSFSSHAEETYGGEQNIILTVSVSRPSTQIEIDTHLAESRGKKIDEKEWAKKEIKRLQKLIEEE